MQERLSEQALNLIRNSPVKTLVKQKLLSHIDALEEELEGYKLQEQIHLNRLKKAEGGNRDAR